VAGPCAACGWQNQDEAGYELLPRGHVLTVDVWTNYPLGNAKNAEQFTGSAWGSAGTMSVSLVDPAVCGNWEIGPAVMRGDGKLIAFGGTTDCPGSTPKIDPTDIYNASAGTWSSGPHVPSICGAGGKSPCDLADAPAALLKTGNILFAAGTGYVSASAKYGNPPTHFFEFTTTNTIVQVADPLMGASNNPSYAYNFLELPTGQILMTDFSGEAEVYTPSGTTQTSWAPSVTSISATTLAPGSSYTIDGKQLNGRSQGAMYGDDAQAATNYPIVKLVVGTHVVYCPTGSYSSYSIAVGQTGSFKFLVPASAPAGAGKLYVITNGISSAAVSVTVT
jgi:hypothetical protein